MPEQKYEEVGFTLNNKMRISLHRPGLSGETVMGEHLDLIVTHPNGKRARIIVTCSGSDYGEKYIELSAVEGGPLKKGEYSFTHHGPSFYPEDFGLNMLPSKGGISMETKGVLNKIKLNLS